MNLTFGARCLRRFVAQRHKDFDRGTGVNAALRFVGPMSEPLRGLLTLTLSPRKRAGVREKKIHFAPTVLVNSQ